MSDSEYRQAVRLALAMGEGLELAKMLISQMDPNERASVIRFAGFMAARMARKWEIQGQKFTIAHLPDELILDICGRSVCKRAVKWRDIRSIYYTIAQEAEYRGLDVEWGDPKKRFFGACIETRHSFIDVPGGTQCVNCRKVYEEDSNRPAPVNRLL